MSRSYILGKATANLLYFIISVMFLFIACNLTACEHTHSIQENKSFHHTTALYGLMHKESGDLYPLIANSSTAYTEFYQWNHISLYSKDNQIYIPYSEDLKQNFALYDYSTHRVISISKSLDLESIRCDGHTVIISMPVSSS